MLRKRLEFHKIEPAILHMKEKFNASCVVLETAGVGIAIGNALVRHEGVRRWLCPCNRWTIDLSAVVEYPEQPF